MKKILMLLLTLGLLLSLSLTAFAAEGGESAPVIKKPVHITIKDEAGAAFAGASMEVRNSSNAILESWESGTDAYTVFLEQGDYSVENVAVPQGYLPDTEIKAVSITVTEGETDYIFVGAVDKDHTHPEVCSKDNHVGLETYTVNDTESGGLIRAYCFNQNYDNPTPDSRYKRLVGTPELLYSLAQNKNDDITPQELYDHVLAIIYHSQEIMAKHGLADDVILTNYLTNMALKHYTDPKAFYTFDDDGNSTREKDENGNYYFRPGGTVLGSMINHARGDGSEFPETYREAYKELRSQSEHPSDYYLYIYYPSNFQPNNTDTFQCLMSTFQIEPIRLQMTVRAAVQISVTKEWDDAGDEDGSRPDAEAYASYVHLLADGEDVTADYAENRSITDNGDGTYMVSFTGLPRQNEGEEILYVIREDEVPGYTADVTEAQDGGTIVNSHVPETTPEETTPEETTPEETTPAETTPSETAPETTEPAGSSAETTAPKTTPETGDGSSPIWLACFMLAAMGTFLLLGLSKRKEA